MAQIADLRPRSLHAIVQSDTVVHSPALDELIVLRVVDTTQDVLRVEDEDGTVVTMTLPDVAEGGCYPWHLRGRIKRVHATATTVADADMIGVKYGVRGATSPT